jgi:hypothetical protein
MDLYRSPEAGGWAAVVAKEAPIVSVDIVETASASHVVSYLYTKLGTLLIIIQHAPDMETIAGYRSIQVAESYRDDSSRALTESARCKPQGCNPGG